MKLHPGPLLDAIRVEVVTRVTGERRYQILFSEVKKAYAALNMLVEAYTIHAT